MKILVTGSNGLLGQKLVHQLKADAEVELIATARGENRLNDKSGYQYYVMDICNRDQVMEVVASVKPNVIINTAAMTNVDACEDDKKACDKLNIDAVSYLIEACQLNKVHLVHISTDFIFDGEDGPYTEEAEARPLSYYGWSKLKGEQLLQESTIDFCILRTVLVYGIAEEMSRSNIVLWAKGALESAKPLSIVNDQYRTPTLAEDLAQGSVLAAKQRAKGVYNISGKDFMSVIDLVRRVAKFWNLNEELISPVSSTTLNQKAKRPATTGFILDKAEKELGYKPHSFEEGLALLDKQLKARA